jgi:hypothetical protein
VYRLSGDSDDQVSHGHLGFHMVTSRVYKSSQPYYVSLRVCSGPNKHDLFRLVNDQRKFQQNAEKMRIELTQNIINTGVFEKEVDMPWEFGLKIPPYPDWTYLREDRVVASDHGAD